MRKPRSDNCGAKPRLGTPAKQLKPVDKARREHCSDRRPHPSNKSGVAIRSESDLGPARYLPSSNETAGTGLVHRRAGQGSERDPKINREFGKRREPRLFESCP